MGLTSIREAPSLLINLIGMFMLKVPTKQDKTWVYGTPDENGNAVAQNVIQKFLIFVAILAIPVMFLAKPYIKYKAHKARQNAGSTQFGGVRVQMSGTDDTTNILEDDELANEHGDGSPGVGGGDVGAIEEFNLTEALVEQMIHTIEYGSSYGFGKCYTRIIHWLYHVIFGILGLFNPFRGHFDWHGRSFCFSSRSTSSLGRVQF